MREHNFQICKWRTSTDPGMVLWECPNCDTQVLFRIGVDAGLINRNMANRLACIDPIHPHSREVAIGDTNLNTARTNIVKLGKRKLSKLIMPK